MKNNIEETEQRKNRENSEYEIMMEKRQKEAEDMIYKSYLKAEKYHKFSDRDATKRRNDLTFDLLRENFHTPCVVITGSKGKGSVAKMISQILQSKYTVGMMTSPHIVDFCERFQINGGKIPKEEFIHQAALIEKTIEDMDSLLPKEVGISPMGIQAYLALRYFLQEKTQFNVFECGKGAKYDDVNNIRHDYAVINRIFLEHTRELGGTLEEIAEDKAHVITGEQKCVYVAGQTPEVMTVIQERAEKMQVTLKRYGKDFWAENIRFTREGMRFDIIADEKNYRDISIPLLGVHQAENCALAFALCQDVLGEFSLDKVKKNLTGICWPGRMEVLCKDPFILLDACIHAVSCKNVLEVLDRLAISEIAVVIGIPDDKDYIGVAKAMKERAAVCILTRSGNAHYKFTRMQQERLRKEGIAAQWTESVEEALQKAGLSGKPIVILGTTSVVAEVKTQKIEEWYK